MSALPAVFGRLGGDPRLYPLVLAHTCATTAIAANGFVRPLVAEAFSEPSRTKRANVRQAPGSRQ